MIDQEIQIIRETWRDVSQVRGTDIGLLFYNKLFENVTHLPHIFQNDLREQSRKFISMMNYIINKLDDASFIQDVRAMGKKYTAYGIEEGHFTQIKDAMFWVLQTKLGERWTPHVMVSWVWCFSMLGYFISEQSRQRM